MAAKIRRVRSWTEACEAIDGRKATVRGMSGTLRHTVVGGMTRVMLMIDAKGRQTAEYQATKRQLRDDWDLDLTNSDTLGPIMHRMGIRFREPGDDRVGG